MRAARIDGLMGLVQVIRRPQLDAAHYAVELFDARNHQHGNVAHGVIGLHGRERLVPVQLGHYHVEEHHLDDARIGREDRQAFDTVLRLEDVEAERLEPLYEQQAVD